MTKIDTHDPKNLRGFASMEASKQREIAYSGLTRGPFPTAPGG